MFSNSKRKPEIMESCVDGSREVFGGLGVLDLHFIALAVCSAEKMRRVTMGINSKKVGTLEAG